MANPPALLTTIHIYFRSGLSHIAIGGAQGLNLRCDTISGPDDDYRSGGILFEVQPYGLAAGFPVCSD